METKQDKSSSDKKTLSPAGGHSPKPVVLVFIVLMLIGLGVFWFLQTQNSPDARNLAVSGRIEGYETNVGAKIGGRVDFISSREGELVTKGQLLVQLSDGDIRAQERAADAKIRAAQEQVSEQTYQIQMIQSQIAQTNLRKERSSEESTGKIREAQAGVARAEADLAQARASLTEAEADAQLASTRKERYNFLVLKQAVTRDEYDEVVTNAAAKAALVKSRQASVTAANKQLIAARGQLVQAQSSRLTPQMETAEVSERRKQLLQSEHQLLQARHEVEAAKAQRDEVSANLAYLRLLAPISGVVTARAVEPGAVVVPGQTLLSLLDLQKVYMRAFVPEGQVGRIRIGQSAKVTLDASPDRPFNAKITQIDPEGTFTPENIYFKDDRVKQVFGIKLEIEQPGGFAKPGMPADAVIALE